MLKWFQQISCEDGFLLAFTLHDDLDITDMPIVGDEFMKVTSPISDPAVLLDFEQELLDLAAQGKVRLPEAA